MGEQYSSQHTSQQFSQTYLVATYRYFAVLVQDKFWVQIGSFSLQYLYCEFVRQNYKCPEKGVYV